MKRPRIGDVFEMRRPDGLVYYQYATDHPFYGPVVRVLLGIFPERPRNLAELVAGPYRFITVNSLKTDLLDGRIAPVGNFAVPPDAASRLIFKLESPASVHSETPVWWTEVEGKPRPIKDQAEARDVPALLFAGAIAISRLIDEGWDGVSRPPKETSSSHDTLPAYFFVICPTMLIAEDVAQYLRARDFFDVEVSNADDDESREPSKFLVVALHSYDGKRSLEKAEETIEEVVKRFDVIYDGNEVPAL